MTARSRTTLIAGTCLVGSMVSCILLLHGLDRLRPKGSLEDVLYIDSPKIVKRASLGFNGLMACIYWTRTVQYFGQRHHNYARTYNELGPLLEITTQLDPYMIPPYQFGASFLAPKPPDGAGEPKRAIQLMEYGIEHNPNDWHLYYNLAFVYYELKDYKNASETFERGSHVPNAHPFMKVMAAQTAEHAGDYTTARMLWSTTLETSTEKDIQQNAIEHLRSIQVDEDVTNLEAAVTRFRKRTGRLPSSIVELATAENLPGVPVDPDGIPYMMSPEGDILVLNPDNFSFITKGIPPGYEAPFAKPHSTP